MLTILDKYQEPVGILSNDMPKACPYLEDTHKEALENSLSLYEFKVPANHSSASLLEVEGFIVYTNLDKKKQLFQIKEINQSRSGKQATKTVFCENAAVSDLNGHVARPIVMSSYTLQQAMEYALQNTGWRLGRVDFAGVKDFEISEHITALEAIHIITQEFGAEMEYEVIFNGTRIVDKHINVLNGRGSLSGKLFTYEKDITGVERVEDSRSLVTALIGVGQGDQDGTLLTFDALTEYPESDRYVKSNDFVADMEAFQRFNKSGKHIFGVFKDSEATTMRELFDNTLERLKELSKPRMTYNISVVLLEKLTGYAHEKVRLGDTVRIQDKTFAPMLLLEARIIEIVRSKTNPSADSVVLGDYVPLQVTSSNMLKKLQDTIFRKEKQWTDASERVTDAIEQAQAAAAKADAAAQQADANTGAIGQLDSRLITAEDDIGQNTQVISTKVSQAIYNQKMLDLEGELAEKVGSLLYENDKLIMEQAIATKVAQEEYDTMTQNLADSLAEKEALIPKQAGEPINPQTGDLWWDTSRQPNVLRHYDGTAWQKATPTNASEVGAYSITQVDDALNGKVSTTTYNTDIDGIVSDISSNSTSISQNATAISLKASQSTVDALGTRMENAETSISQNATAITLKASQSELDTVEERMTSAEASITVNANNITSKVSQTVYEADMNDPETGLKTRLSTAESNITQNADSITSKVSVTDYQADMNGVTTRLSSAESSITQNADAIVSKVEQTDFNTLESRVTGAESSITQNADAITSKVSQTEFNTLDGQVDDVTDRISTAESTITQHADQINSKVSQTDFNAVEGRVTTAESNITQNANSISSKVERTEFVRGIYSLETQLMFDGVDDYVVLPSHTMAAAASSVQIRFHLESIPSAGSILLSNEVSTYSFLGVNSDGTIRAETDVNNGSMTSTEPIPINEVVMLTLVFNASTYTFYLGEEVIGSGTITAGLTFKDIGRSIDGLDATYSYPAWLHGSVYEMRVWDKALTPAEIATNIDEGVTKDTPGLVNLWAIDEGIEDAVGDPVGGQSGQIFGATWKGIGYRTADLLGERISSAEQLITEDAIINKVISSTSFTQVLDGKADSEAVGSMATKEELEGLETNLQGYADDAIAALDFSPYITSSELEQTTDAFNFQFSRGGGVNLVKNSTAYVGTDFWTVSGLIDTVNNGDMDTIGTGSGFALSSDGEPSTMTQLLKLIGGQTYTVSFFLKKEEAPSTNVRIIEGGEILEIIQLSDETANYAEYSFTFTPVSNEVEIMLWADKGLVIYSGIMVNIGAEALQWSMATGEVYNANVKMDANGIKVLSSMYEGYTQITPEEFAGYAEVDGNMEKVFTLNKDTTEMSKARIDAEITMSPIKIVPLRSGGYNGWAFVKEE